MQALSKLHSLSDIHSSGTSFWALFCSFDSLKKCGEEQKLHRGSISLVMLD